MKRKSRKALFLRFVSIHLWGNLPAPVQKKIYRVYSAIYNRKWSRYLIKPYCKLYCSDTNYLSQFKPASGKERYQSFQDFFTRTFKTPPQITGDSIWPCEGLLCKHGKISELPLVNVKGDKRNVRTIFGEGGKDIPDNYFFSNVFLHNNNYHRIHSPVTGKVVRIEHVPGNLVLLRPWAYPKNPSFPALRNERFNIDLLTSKGMKWFLSIVGGIAVGTILLSDGVEVGSLIDIGDELATFLLGSTCCIAAPKPSSKASVGNYVEVGDTL